MAKETKTGAPAEKAAASKKPPKGDKPAAKTSAAAPESEQAQAVARPNPSEGGKPRLQQHYEAEIRKAMQDKFGYQNVYQVPKLDKIVINTGVGEATTDARRIQAAVTDITAISGQKPIVTKSRKSIAQFKLREGMPVGVKVTLRRERMYEFLDRLITIAMPRVRDFRGVPGNSFDGNGNYALGLKEQIVFPEIDYDKIDVVRGMDIVICTTAKTDEEAKELLRGFNMPFVA